MIYRTDYHVHTTFSDGRSLPDAYVGPALEAGMSELGFSEHITLFRDPDKWNMDPANTGNYLTYLHELRARTHNLRIRKGLEVDFFKGKEEETRSFLSGLDLDYVIGSVHYMGNTTVDSGPDYYENKDIDKLFAEYFDIVISAINSGLFDIIGHPDLVRIYGYRMVNDPEPLYYKLASALKDNNVAFEVNTNGRNRPLADFYPDRRFLHVFRELNVPVCVNSDAHMPSRIGQYFDEAYELLRYTGFTEMAVFEGRKMKLVPF